MARTEIEFPSLPNARLLYGIREANLRFLESELSIECKADGNIVSLSGASDDVKIARDALASLYEEAPTITNTAPSRPAVPNTAESNAAIKNV